MRFHNSLTAAFDTNQYRDIKMNFTKSFHKAMNNFVNKNRQQQRRSEANERERESYKQANSKILLLIAFTSIP